MANTRSSHRPLPDNALRASAIALALGLTRDEVRIFARLRSTNEYAAKAVDDGILKPEALVAASLQTAGRGQSTNTWWSDGGSLCATFVLPSDPAMPIGQVPLRAGLAVAEVVSRILARANVHVKWPNDVFVNGRKIAGILCQRRRDSDLIGIGLNVTTDLRRAPRDVRERATSLAQHIKHPPRRGEVLSALWNAVRDTRGDDDWIGRYNRMHLLQTRRISLTSGNTTHTGICRGIDHDGRILLEVGGKIIALTEGNITTIAAAQPEGEPR